MRKDTKDVLDRLKEGGMSVAMVTGDAILTAAHVAKEVGICDPDPEAVNPSDELQKLLLKKKVSKRPILILEESSRGKTFTHLSRRHNQSIPHMINLLC